MSEGAEGQAGNDLLLTKHYATYVYSERHGLKDGRPPREMKFYHCEFFLHVENKFSFVKKKVFIIVVQNPLSLKIRKVVWLKVKFNHR